jgi:glycosyltransferase involved in cell wall biosynthesis
MKIAIVFPSGHFITTPSIPSLAILLARHGFEVDIYAVANTTTARESSYAFLENVPNITLHLFFIKIDTFFENIPLLLAGFLPWFIGKQYKKNYDIVIGAGIRALFLIGILSFFTKIKGAFLCLELYPKKEQRTFMKGIYKILEGIFTRRTKFAIIQDELRAEILRRENNYQGKILIFPNAGLPATKKITTDKAFIKKFGINGKKTVLYAGSIFFKFAMTEELLRDTPKWPDDWVLLVHSKAKMTESEKQVSLQIEGLENRVYLSTDPLDECDYEALVQSVDVGIALYDGTLSENFYYLGYSSGKIAQYLRCGIPVIINRLPLIDEFIEEYRCGKVIDSFTQIRGFLTEIGSNYDYYSRNAKKAYLGKINPELYIDQIINAISLVSKS